MGHVTVIRKKSNCEIFCLMVVMNNSAYVKKIKIGIISARAHLLQARQNHREVFSKGLANASVVDCRRSQ
jgi:hypothetical protein